MKKIDNFFGLWCCIMGAAGEDADDDPLGTLLDKIFQEEYKDGREAMNWFEEGLGKVKDSALREKLKDAAAEVVRMNRHLHLAAGFALGGLYDVMDPDARVQVEYLRKRIHDGGVFPMPAKLKLPDTRELSASAAVADAVEKGREDKKGPKPEKGFLTIAEAAAFLGFCTGWVYRKAKAKIIPHVRVGRNYTFVKKDLEAWMNAHKERGCLKI